MAAASPSANPRKTLAEILNVEPELLREKFHLEPLHSYDPQKKDNLAFLSPIVCLEDLELREGGWKDRGAKEVLGLLAKDILKSKDYSLFQVPEITLFQMGYGKTSENKKTNMAINEFEAKAWMNVFDLAARKANLSSNADVDDMQEEFLFPSPEDTHALEGLEEVDDSEDVIYPADSGLKIVVKPSYLLFFSILMIFYKKKLEVTASRKINIGGNKISDFLLFWILPYLLNYTELQISKVNEHHRAESKRRNGAPDFSVPSVAMSAKDIIRNAFRSCNVPGKLQEKVLARLKKYYGTDQLEHKYNLPAVETSGKLFPFIKEPVILVPRRYQVNDMPVEIEDIGRRWKDIGNITLLDEFINKFIDNREIQEDILLDAFRELKQKERCSLNYGILLPDEETFTTLMEMADENPDIFRNMKCTVIDKQGRNLATPRIGLVRNGGTYLSVCFSYFEGKLWAKILTLFDKEVENPVPDQKFKNSKSLSVNVFQKQYSKVPVKLHFCEKWESLKSAYLLKRRTLHQEPCSWLYNHFLFIEIDIFYLSNILQGNPFLIHMVFVQTYNVNNEW